MGLSKWNEALRTPSYPPGTFSSAVDFSLSDEVEKSYQRAEELIQKMIQAPPTRFTLPPWAMTWPSGQLSSFGRNGSFAFNIRRYERVFLEFFLSCQGVEMVPPESKLRYVNVVLLESLGEHSALVKALTTIVKQISQRRIGISQFEMEKSVDRFCCRSGVHRNASMPLPGQDLEPTLKDKARLARIFAQDSRDLESLCGVRFGWKCAE